MNQELNKYFKAAKSLNNFKEPLDERELEVIFSKSDNVYFLSNYVKLTGVVVMLMICAILVFFTLSQFSGINQNNEIKPENVKRQNRNNGITASDEVSQKIEPEFLKNNSETETNNKKQTKEINPAITNLILVEQKEKSIIQHNPFRTKQREELIRSSGIGLSGGGNIDFLEPATLQTDAKGNAIAGMLTLQLSKKELANIGVYYDDSKISYYVEYYHTLHPIPMRNNDSYRLDPANKDVAVQKYPVNGDTLLVKATHIIDLNFDADISVMSEPSSPGYAYTYISNNDTVNGKIRRNLRKVLLDTKDFKYGTIDIKDFNFGTDYLEYEKNWKKRYLQGYSVDIKSYEGWDKAQFSRTVPVIAAFKYNGTRHRYIYQPYDSPIRLNYLKEFDYSKLIPLVLRFSEKQLIEKLILWYYPTPEFISLLPERYQKVLSNELSVLSKLENGELDINSACELVEEETFFDICRFQNGAVSIENIYPNPASEPVVTIDFKLLEMREIEINVYDVQGNFTGKISQPKNFAAGNNSIKINLGKLTTGIYILGLKTDKNEFVSQRIVIN